MAEARSSGISEEVNPSQRIGRFDVEMRRMRERFENQRKSIEQAHEEQCHAIEQQLVREPASPFVTEGSQSRYLGHLVSLLADLAERSRVEDQMKQCCEEVDSALSKAVQMLAEHFGIRIEHCRKLS